MLHVRRERTRLLAAYDRALVSYEPRGGAWSPRLAAGAAAAIVVVLGLVLWRARSVVPMGHPRPVVRADDGAVWSERTVGEREEIALSRGALWIHVAHDARAARLLVVLPDGDLEDTGTTFTVIAEDGHTSRVVVEEGVVVLRLRGEPAVTLGAGEAWSSTPHPPAPAAGSAAPSAEAPAADARPRPVRVRPERTAPASSAVEPEPQASVDFRAAMAALDEGDNLKAAEAFGRFLVNHAEDGRAEDAAYLRVIALQRSGDLASTKEAAVEYLRRYPEGFRRAEIRTLAR